MNSEDILNTINYRLKRYETFELLLDELKSSNNNHRDCLVKKEKDLKVIQESAVYYKRSQDILYEKSVGALRDLINSALSFVFYDKRYEISINLEDKRGTKTLGFNILDLDNGTEVNIKNGCGNGVRSVVSAILNIFAILNKNSKILILDEKYSHISTDYISSFFEFLNKICQDKQMRIIMVTHDQRFLDFADKTYRVTDGRIEEL